MSGGVLHNRNCRCLLCAVGVSRPASERRPPMPVASEYQQALADARWLIDFLEGAPHSLADGKALRVAKMFVRNHALSHGEPPPRRLNIIYVDKIANPE